MEQHQTVPQALAQKVIVIGGGAAGFFGAIACGEACADCQITLLEAAPKVLAKVRISGGGRCNVTHHCFDPALLVQNYPRGGKALRGAFSRFQPQDTIAWYKKRGVRLHTEADGRMFPVTNDSGTIIHCLMAEAQRLGIRVQTKSAVQRVERQDGQFRVILRSQEVYGCDRLLLATGSSPQGYAIARSLGHTLEPPVPSLFTFNVPDPHLHNLAGIGLDSVRVQLSLPGVPPLIQTGPILITHWGLSGPVILKLSAWGARVLHDAGYQGTLQINWLAHLPLEQLRQRLQDARKESPKRAIANYCPLEVPQRLWHYWLHQVGLDPTLTWANLPKSALNQLVSAISKGTFHLRGKGVFKDEFVTCGGIKLSEVNFKTMESRPCPGLFLAGEVLDIDGITGGFNFQSAWTTGWLAGQGLCQESSA